MEQTKIKELTPIPINLTKMDEITSLLEAAKDREEERYARTILGISQALNCFTRGSITKIDVEELRGQTGHLLFYKVKEVPGAIPFDLEFLFLLKSHFKNPTILILRRIRKFLMPAHRKILSKLEEEQNQERRLKLRSLDVNRKVKGGLEEMQRYQTMAQLTKSVSRKLDILTKAVHVPAQSHSDFALLNGMLSDEFNLRHDKAMDWLDGSFCKGNLNMMNKTIERGLFVLKKKSKTIVGEMKELSGLIFDEERANTDPSLNWYAMCQPTMQRGEEFVKIFNSEENIDDKIKRLTFFSVRSSWDAGRFQDIVDRLHHSKRALKDNASRLASVYFEIEKCIAESSRPDGKAHTAIESDVSAGTLNEKEAEEAREWVEKNKSRLQALQLQLFQTLADLKVKDSDIALPEKLEQLIESNRSESSSGVVDDPPAVPLDELRSEMQSLSALADMPESDLLEALCALRQKILEHLTFVNGLDYQRNLRASAEAFQDFEERLLNANRVVGELENLRVECETCLLNVYRLVRYSEVKRPTMETAFEVVIDHMLLRIKKLDYEVIDAEIFREWFEHALDMAPEDSLHQLDALFYEVHSIPRQGQLLMAINDWEATLDPQEFDEKQSFILENEYRLQEIVDDVRAELRERMADNPIESRRLRFDVFSLADCYADNLRALLSGLMRMAPEVVNEKEGERLIENIQSIESQIIEAQRVSKPDGEAFRKLKELERAKLLPDEFANQLREDLTQNFKELDQLLKEVNGHLKRVRLLQNRFGGKFDTQAFAMTINLHDLEQLKGIYNFVDNITMMDIKRFGLIYKLKNSMLEDIYKRAYDDAPGVSPVLTKLINRRVYKAFTESKNVPLDIKIVILKEVPELLESECELLIRTLNFVSDEHVRDKVVYRSVQQMLEQAGADRNQTKTIQRLWVHFQKKVRAHEPRNYRQNYQRNMETLMEDAKSILDGKT